MKIFRRPIPEIALIAIAMLPLVPAARAESRRFPLVPYPASVRPLDGLFEPRGGLRVVVSQPANRELHELGELAAEVLRDSFGLRPTLVPEGAGERLGPALRLSLVALGRGASAESYLLEVTSSGIALSAPSPAGLFYGLQTLRQLLAGAGAAPSIPAVRIEDTPRFPYRGIAIDAAKDMMPVESIERWVDLAARYKINAVRWRLSGPGFWRLEIPTYPRLTEGAAGAFQQEEVRQVVDYARERHVAIVPDLDLSRPGAMLESIYPDLACEPDQPCPTPAWVAFASDVTAEVVDLFPSSVLALGGAGGALDAATWQRVSGVLATHGRELAVEGEAPAGSARGVVLLRGGAPGSKAAGYEVIATLEAPASLGEACALDPAPDGGNGVRGAELRGADVAMPLMPSPDGRLPAVSEALWSAAGSRDAADLAQRLERWSPPTPAPSSTAQ